MKEQERHLEGIGEMDYDYLNDILFFKVKDREYEKSIEFENMVIDLDNEDYIVGIQIFDASEFLGIAKSHLKINNWQFKARITPNAIEVRLVCQINVRNMIKELSSIIIQQNQEGLPNSSAVVVMAN